MYPENPEGTQVIIGSMNMGYISDTARNRTHDLFRPKREPIPLISLCWEGNEHIRGGELCPIDRIATYLSRATSCLYVDKK